VTQRHLLTAEERRRGAIRANEVRRERGKSMRERFAEKLEADAEELYAVFKRAWEGGDWKAAQAALNQAFGRPPQSVAIGSDPEPVQIIVGSVLGPDEPPLTGPTA
jgi:hypothetical protein